MAWPSSPMKLRHSKAKPSSAFWEVPQILGLTYGAFEACFNRSRMTIKVRILLALPGLCLLTVCCRRFAEVDELVPRDGKDERYDEVVAEMDSLEKSLDADLTKFEKSLGYRYTFHLFDSVLMNYVNSIKLAYWHSAVGNKVLPPLVSFIKRHTDDYCRISISSK